MILHRPALLVGQKCAVFQDDLFAQRLETGFHQVSRSLGVGIVNGEFVELATEEAAFDRSGLSLGQEALFRGDFHDPDRGLVAGQGDRDIQCVASGPGDQFFWRISPAQAEGRLNDRLGHGAACCHTENTAAAKQSEKKSGHVPSFSRSRPLRKPRSLRRGFVLVEAMMGLSLLTLLGLVLLKLSLNILTPRQWILQQSVTDAYMSYERAYAERIPFESLVAADSPWPASTASSVTSKNLTVEVGRLPRVLPNYPAGVPIIGIVTRTRFPDPGNYPIDGGSGTVASNPAAMKVWKVQSVLTYTVGSKTYAKSRTVLRTQ